MSDYVIACIEHQLLRKPGFYQRPKAEPEPEPEPVGDIIDISDNDVLSLIGKEVVKIREAATLKYWVDRLPNEDDNLPIPRDMGRHLYLDMKGTHRLIVGTQGHLAKRWAEGPRPGDHRRHGRRPEDYSIKPRQLRTKYYKKWVDRARYSGGWDNPHTW
jgi:hypothetical protein